MSAPQSEATGPDLTLGVAIDTIADGKMLAGHVGEDAVLLARRGNEFFAIGATCTHYNGPLAEGLMVHDTVRCPWHHACFSLRTGEAVRAPALSPVACWRTEVRGDKVFVREKAAPTPSSRVAPAPGVAAEDRGDRRRRGRLRRRGNAASPAFPGRHRDVERRRRAAGGPAEPVQGLPGRQLRRRSGSRCAETASTPNRASTCG